ncbi:plasmid partitioning protein RepB [Sulfitobacter guttiformis]|uniref:ParB family chromosome partitioning protein n=1 Tax=Sulfitobacter guttiformis TaxID=74349 RepID=J7G038_9RHOB|nr:plasmid partitioning protein RepB [Sulfitobacter guttiformis]AFP55372.1 plasmid partitioning protein RepB-8 [Sulfitobacter guttiformis]KIN75560.1 Plasmid partitioning protein RepB-8 [Sulfitobacter guttiformis KCTC 32187]RKE91037.1 ParB family chromosome partitioning protein [Sulfitobacter guttiformis]
MARKGILGGDIPAKTERRKPVEAPHQPRGAVGALQSSLTKLQENAVQEIDASLIDDAGIEDRLGVDSAAQTQLRESLKAYGQQVPVLLRPHAKKPGRFEIVYGRRRLKALRDLGIPVKAMIRQLDDHALVMAQGQENTARQDLSFIEKASFAAQLAAQNYERQTIADALSIDLPMVSRMLKVGTAFPLPFLRQIGSAPGIGRDRWMALAKALEDNNSRGHTTALMNTPEFGALGSDARFEAVFERAARVTPAAPRITPKPRTLRGINGKALADIKSTSKGVTLTISAKGAEGFDTWVDGNAETLLQELHDRWQQQRRED